MKNDFLKIETIKDGNYWYAMKRVKDESQITGIYQWVKSGKTKQKAINLLKTTLNIK